MAWLLAATDMGNAESNKPMASNLRVIPSLVTGGLPSRSAGWPDRIAAEPVQIREAQRIPDEQEAAPWIEARTGQGPVSKSRAWGRVVLPRRQEPGGTSRWTAAGPPGCREALEGGNRNIVLP